MPHASFIFVGKNVSLLCLMFSQSGEGKMLLSNFACHLSPNHFKDEALAKDFLPFSPCFFSFSLPSFFCAFSCSPSCSCHHRLLPGNRGHLNSSAQCHKKALEFYFQMSLQQHTSATWRASARLFHLREPGALIEPKTKNILIIVGNERSGLPNKPFNAFTHLTAAWCSDYTYIHTHADTHRCVRKTSKGKQPA